MQSAARRARGGKLEKRFAKMDADGSGAIEATEFNDLGAKRFERMDANGDGALTLDEIEVHRQKRKDRKQG